jgi:hypothetical protein
MTDQELRAMIRESIARHAGGGPVRLKPDTIGVSQGSPHVVHASHARLALLRSGDEDGACLIEPAVRCNHCGFCLSYGH